MPRPLNQQDQAELLRAEDKLRKARERVEGAQAERDALIADLLDSGARGVDIAAVLDITRKAVADARNRARR